MNLRQSNSLFWPVTGSDFARSIKWAKGQANPVLQAIKRKVSK